MSDLGGLSLSKRAIERCMDFVGRKLSFRFYFLQFMDYYWVVPDRKQLRKEIWSSRSELPGVNLQIAGQLERLEKMEAFSGELQTLSKQFGSVDAEVLYCMLRMYKPRQVIEIGAGFSTQVMAAALLRNSAESGQQTDFTTIEPFPNATIERGFPGLNKLIRKKVQDVPLREFAKLGNGDLLFIDSSHVLTIGSDVQYEFLEIIPRLAPGVLVHIHDIFFPCEYHRGWVMQGRFWSEQYILQAFLQFNSAFEVLMANQYLHCNHAEKLQRAFPDYDPQRDCPSSF